MQTFLQILAVIGIVLLVLIGLILLIVGFLLFVPIRYKVKANKDTDILLQVKVTWFLRLLSVRYNYPEPNEIQARIFGRKVWSMKIGGEKEEEPAEQEEQEKQKNQEEQEKQINQEEQEKQKEQKEQIPQNTEVPEKEPAKENAEEPAKKGENVPEDKPSETIFEKIQYKIKNIYDKIKKILDDYVYYRDLLQQKDNRLLFERCKNRIFKVLNHIKPRTLKADLLFGTGEPDTTGYVMAIYGMLSPVHGYDINITPDFDRKIFEGRLYVKGRITVFNLLYNGLKIYFDEQLHKLMDNLKRKDV